MPLENLWYLGHPVAPSARYTLKQNLVHAEKCARIFWDAGFRIVMPWFSHCHFLDDSNPEHRSAGLECDLLLIRHLRKVIFVGHELSTGMQKEALEASACNSTIIIATQIPDRDLPHKAEALARKYL